MEKIRTVDRPQIVHKQVLNMLQKAKRKLGLPGRASNCNLLHYFSHPRDYKYLGKHNNVCMWVKVTCSIIKFVVVVLCNILLCNVPIDCWLRGCWFKSPQWSRLEKCLKISAPLAPPIIPCIIEEMIITAPNHRLGAIMISCYCVQRLRNGCLLLLDWMTALLLLHLLCCCCCYCCCCRHVEYEVSGVKRMQMQFYLEGPLNKATVHVEVQQVVLLLLHLPVFYYCDNNHLFPKLHVIPRGITGTRGCCSGGFLGG